MAPHSSTLAWKIPWTEEPGGLQSMGSWTVGHDWATSLSLFTFMHWRRKWQPTPVFLPGESQGHGTLVGCCLWGRTESDMTEATQQQRLVIAFLPKSKRRLISWLQSPPAVILEPKKIKSLSVSIVSPSICHEVMGPDAMILVFWMLSFKPTFPPSSLTFIKRLLSSSLLSAIRWCHLHIWGYWYFSQQSWL